MWTDRRVLLPLAALAFGGVATLGLLIPTLQPWDDAVHSGLRGWAAGPLGVVTYLGATPVVALVDAAAFAGCWRQGRRRAAAFVAVAGVGTWVLRVAVRTVVARPRPPDPLWTADGPAFPSGHTTNATVMAVVVAVALWPLVGRVGHVVLVGAVPLLGGLVGLSRVTGGVHWPTDVVAGLLFACGSCLTVAAFTENGKAQY